MSKKTNIIAFKIEPEIKAEFETLCSEKHTTPSRELQIFIYDKIKALKAKRIPLRKSNRKQPIQ